MKPINNIAKSKWGPVITWDPEPAVYRDKRRREFISSDPISWYRKQKEPDPDDECAYPHVIRLRHH